MSVGPRGLFGRGHTLPTLALLGAALLWGGSYASMQALADSIGVPASLAARFVVAAVLLAVVWAVVVGRSTTRLPLGIGLLLGGLRALTLTGETIGVTQTTAVNAGVLIGLSVVFTPFLEAALARRRVRRSWVMSALIAFLGIALLASSNGGAFQLYSGDFWILGAACTRATLMVCAARFGGRAHPISTTFVEVAFGALVFGAVGGASLITQLPTLRGVDWFNIAVLSIGCTVVAFLLVLWGSVRTSASHASVLLGSEPVWAVLVGVVVVGDAPGLLGLLGAGLIVAAMFLSQRSMRQSRELEQSPPGTIEL
ncbi:MAG: DMT family transporter [Agromyces sp.]